MFLVTAFFGTRLQGFFEDFAKNGHTARSQNLPVSLISRAALQQDMSGETRHRTELTRADTGMVAEKPREVGGLVEPEPRPDLSDVDVVVHDRLDSALQAHDVEIDPGRYADRGFE
jgi:hypothetical protein